MTFTVLLAAVLTLLHLGPEAGPLLAADLRARCAPGRGRHRRRGRHAAPARSATKGARR